MDGDMWKLQNINETIDELSRRAIDAITRAYPDVAGYDPEAKRPVFQPMEFDIRPGFAAVFGGFGLSEPAATVYEAGRESQEREEKSINSAVWGAFSQSVLALQELRINDPVNTEGLNTARERVVENQRSAEIALRNIPGMLPIIKALGILADDRRLDSFPSREMRPDKIKEIADGLLLRASPMPSLDGRA